MELSCLDKVNHGAKIADLYRQGHSIPEISKLLKKSKESVRAHLERAGILPCPAPNSATPPRKVLRGKVRWNSPYGFQYVKGRAERHPQEFVTLQIIFQLRDSGLNPREIADKLNVQRLRPRIAQRWDRCTVHRILEWHDKRPDFMKEALTWDLKSLSR